MLFINTRPTDRAQTLTACLRQKEIEVIELPLLELVSVAFDLSLKDLYPQLFDTQVIVVVSPTAVNVGMQYLKASGLCLTQLKHLKWIAVGRTTAEVLAEYGVESEVPEVETSEGMLSLPILKQNKDLKKIAFWRGEGGRQFMMQHCLNNEINVLNFILYRRRCPDSTFEKAKTIRSLLLAQIPQVDVCVTSEASWKNWLNLFSNDEVVVGNCHYLVLGERLYQLLSDDKKRLGLDFGIMQIDNLHPETLFNAIVKRQRMS